MRRAVCEVARIASCASQGAECDPATRSEMVSCVPPLTHKYTPRCSHLLGRALSQVAPRRNWGLVACDGLSCSRVRSNDVGARIGYSSSVTPDTSSYRLQYRTINLAHSLMTEPTGHRYDRRSIRDFIYEWNRKKQSARSLSDYGSWLSGPCMQPALL